MKKIISLLLLLGILDSLTILPVAAEEPQEPENPLVGKSVLFVGDSICEARCEWGNARVGWAGRIIQDNHMQGDNLSKAGAAISNCRGENTVLAQLKQQSDQTYQYVILHGGVNDAWDSAPVGIVTEGYDGPFDESTFTGGLEQTLQYAREHFPNAIFGYIINYQLPMAPYGRLSNMEEYIAATQQICEKWDVPYLDLYHNTEFNQEVLQVREKTNLPDGIHPNTAGYEVLTPPISSWMKELAAQQEPEAQKSEEPSGESSAASHEEKSSEGSRTDGAFPAVLAVLPVFLLIAAIIVVILVVLININNSRS